MNGSFRLGLPAVVSLAINGLMVMMMLYLGTGQMQQRKDPSGLTVLSLAVPMGEDEGQEKQQAQPEKSAPVPAPAKASQPLPVPEPVVEMPAPLITPPATPLAIAAPATISQTAPTEAAAAKLHPSAASASAGSAEAQPRRGARDGLNADAPPGNSRSYAAKIRSWLYAHKIYPKRSRMRREEGIIRVQFVLDRQGHLLEGRVIQGSGFPALDQEGQAMLYRASPYPAAPREISGDRIEFTAPIEFILPT